MTKPTSPDATAAPPSPFSWMTLGTGSPLDAFARTGEACQKAALAWQEEVARFMTARLESDNRFGQKLIACRDWAAAAKLQTEWAAAIAQDYLDETNRLVRLASQVVPEAQAGARRAMPPAAD